MQRAAARLVILFLSASLFSCGFLASEEDETPPAFSGESVEDYFPLTLGSTWRYQTYFTNITPDTATNLYISQIVKDTVVDGTPAVIQSISYATTDQWTAVVLACIDDTIRKRLASGQWEILYPVNLLPNRGSRDTLWSSGSDSNIASWVVTNPDTAVTIPAGTFDSCVVVQFRNRNRLTGVSSYSEDYIFRRGIGPLVWSFEYPNFERMVYTLQDYVIF